MKITIFGLTLSSSWGNGHATPYRAILKALHRLGHEIVFFEKDVDYYARRRDFDRCDFCELVLYDNWENVRAQALAEAAESDVAMVASFCPEGSRISDEVLGLSHPLKVFYDLDTPVTLGKLANGGAEYLRKEQIGAFDLVLSFTGGRVLRELEEKFGARMARPLYGCVDPDVYARVAAQPEFTCALSYMGTYSPDRQKKLEELFIRPAARRRDLQFLLAGTLYPWDWEWPANVRRFDHVAPADHPALYSSSRQTLNITRKEMAQGGYCPSGRFFEAAACGTPIISDYFEGLETFFNPESEVCVVHCCEALLDALDEGDAEITRRAKLARARTLDEHTGMHRAKEMLGYFEQARHAFRMKKPRVPASRVYLGLPSAGMEAA